MVKKLGLEGPEWFMLILIALVYWIIGIGIGVVVFIVSLISLKMNVGIVMAILIIWAILFSLGGLKIPRIIMNWIRKPRKS